MKLQELEAERKSVKKVDVEEPSEDKNAPVVRLVRSVMMGAVNAGASDIHLEPHDPQMRVRSMRALCVMHDWNQASITVQIFLLKTLNV